MSSMPVPTIGALISIISKNNIRYEGRLHTINPKECSIELYNVRCFGTEDREAAFPVGPQSQIYICISYQSSDIKNILVLNESPPCPNWRSPPTYSPRPAIYRPPTPPLNAGVHGNHRKQDLFGPVPQTVNLLSYCATTPPHNNYPGVINSRGKQFFNENWFWNRSDPRTIQGCSWYHNEPEMGGRQYEANYDFEKANKGFGTHQSDNGSRSKQMDGKIERNGNFGSAIGAGAVTPENNSGFVCYDRNRSFFDHISYDRNPEKGKSGCKEDKWNYEPSGVSPGNRGTYYKANAKFNGSMYHKYNANFNSAGTYYKSNAVYTDDDNNQDYRNYRILKRNSNNDERAKDAAGTVSTAATSGAIGGNYVNSKTRPMQNTIRK